MQQVETAKVPANHVVSELVRGYMLNDRLMRPALVAVSKLPGGAQPEVNRDAVASGPDKNAAVADGTALANEGESASKS
jgi:molecular chaperone GrpE